MTPHLWRIFGWQVVRDLRRHPFLALLNILSVALGIAVYLAIQIANQGANRSFAATVDLVAGKAHLEVRGEIDENLWPRLAHAPGITAATGLVEGLVTLPDFPGEYLRIAGVDFFSGEPFRTFEPGSDSPQWNLERWLGRPGTIALGAEFARQHGLHPGTTLRALVNGRLEPLFILTLIETNASPAAAEPRFAMMDIGWAQELFGRQGKLSAIQLLVDQPEHAGAIARALNRSLPTNLSAEAPRQRSFQLQHLVSAFQLNLTALSLISLLVGVFLIYNTISAAVTRRRREIGILRALGATRWEVRALFLSEAGLFGLAGVAVGCAAGTMLAQSLSTAVAHTITSLYVLLSIGHTSPGAFQLLTAAIFGAAAVLVGAWLPAAEAARVDPVAALSLGPRTEHRAARPAGLNWLALAIFFLGGLAAFAALRGGPAVLGFAAAFCILAGAALLSAAAIHAFGKLATASLFRTSIAWRLAADHLRRSAPRNAMTVAALSAAIIMLTGLTVMIFSFRQSVSAWIDRGIVADLFIAPASNEQIGLGADVPPAAVAWLEARPEVAAVDTIREQSVSVQTRANDRAPASAQLLAIRGAFRHNLEFRGGNAEARAARVFGGGAVAVTESFARHFAVQDGSTLTLLTPRGPASFPIAGIYSDYSRDQGVILMDRRNFDQWWREPAVQSLAVFLKSGQPAEPVADAFRARFSREGEFSIYSNRALRRRILTVFDQTFAVTSILRTVALLVAITGVYLSVATLVTEREREIGLLRSIGASRVQIQQLFIAEAGLIGLISTALGLAAGAALAVILTKVVNPAFFGWTITLHFPWRPLLATPFWVTAAAALAAWHPAWRATRRNIAEAVREE